MNQLAAGVLEALRDAFGWAPAWVYGIVLLVVAAALGLLIHRVLMAVARRLLGERHPYLHSLVERTRGPTRMAAVVFMLGLVLPSVPFGPVTRGWLQHLLFLAFIVLLGWVAMTAVRLAADLYLRRFRVDTEDNLLARKHYTQVRILERSAVILIVVVTIAAALMTFDTIREYGVGMLASAGAAGLVVGFAATPLLSNLIAGIQLAVTQPIRIDDAVIVEGEWGLVEEITSTYVVIKIWDWRRLIVPLSYFIQNPFQNWTRESASLIGSVYLYVDYSVPVDRLREKLKEVAASSPLWDGQVVTLQVVDATERTIQLRCLVSARNGGQAWDLRCLVREKLVAFLRDEYPHALPRWRGEITDERRAMAERMNARPATGGDAGPGPAPATG